MRGLIGAAIAVGLVALAPRPARAFCGFYVSGAGGALFNDATQVVLLRLGTRTVLSMQNDYRGPVEAFALVVPVPVVLHEGDVKTLPKAVFAKVDAMGAPRLVEYWEQDPCEQGMDEEDKGGFRTAGFAMRQSRNGDDDYKVTIEAQFDVDEYKVVVLSAEDSTGLDRWLRDNGYRIPDGAEPLLRPYVEGGSKFFVARVDPAKVKFEDGRAALSPLRVHYDADDFALPIRLGLANSSGTQDLIVNILAPNQRYELANYKNVIIPTNLDVKDEVRRRFGEFYAALFDRTLEVNPGAIVTEYAWDASSCDPCPGPTLDGSDFATLGADALAGERGRAEMYGGGFVLTRVHARYGKDGAPDDLVFRAAPAIVGGRENRDQGGRLEERAQPSDYNNFQARYAIRHAWTGPITCDHPVRGKWGGPPPDQQQIASGPVPATDLAFAPRGQVQLPQLVAQDVPELRVVAGEPMPKSPGFSGKPAAGGSTCGCGAGAGGGAGALALGGLVALVLARRRRAS